VGEFGAPAAAALARELLATLGDRWLHVQAVGAGAVPLSRAVPESDKETLIASAWLHDIGYAKELAVTGFHALDGARYLRSSGWPEGIVCLVAHHSGAKYEAEARDLVDELQKFIAPRGALIDALITADMTHGPQGQEMTFDDRIQEILTRHPANSPVHRAFKAARRSLASAVSRTEARMAQGG
jgi:hypothetical protein